MVLAVCASCDTPTASRPIGAYNPTTLTGGLRYRWESGTTVRVWIVESATSNGLDLSLAVRRAMSAWNAVREFDEFTLKSASSIHDADVIVFDLDSPVPVAPSSCTFDPRGSSGYTFFCPDNGVPRRAERLTLLNGGVSAATVVIRVDRGRLTSQSGLNAVLTHEFGHALGIGAHSEVSTDVMFGLPTAEIPSSRDAGTLRYLLGQPADVHL